jgi:hypothetical protein
MVVVKGTHWTLVQTFASSYCYLCIYVPKSFPYSIKCMVGKVHWIQSVLF